MLACSFSENCQSYSLLFLEIKNKLGFKYKQNEIVCGLKELVLCIVNLTLGKFGPHPGDSFGAPGVLFFVGVKGIGH